MKKKKKRKKKDGWETLKSSLSATGMMFNIDLVLVLRTCMYVCTDTWYRRTNGSRSFYSVSGLAVQLRWRRVSCRD